MGFLFCLCLSLSPQEPPDHWFAEDKVKHFFTSFAATTISASGARMLGLDARAAAYAGAGAAGALGLWKEVRDSRVPGATASIKDLVWDGAGIAAGTAVMLQVR
ncbi:MAG TPA: hypothetical protein VF167_12305 [Longimicrobiaceae bacterium]